MVHMSRPHNYLVPLLLATALIAGCTQSTTDLYDDYMSRLSNVLDVDTVDWQAPPPAGAPRTRTLTFDLDDIRMTPIAYWNLRHCELFSLISDRNSILGRVAPPNIIWLYEARVLYAIQTCREHPDTSESLQAHLDDWQNQKTAVWPQATWNGTLAAPEVRGIWQASQTAWPPERVPSISELNNHLFTLTTWAEEWPSDDMVDNSAFSQLYQEIGQHNTGGQWRRSVQISLHGLEAANQMLQNAIDAGQLCPAGQPTRSAEHAENVLNLFFIGEVQPYIAQLNRHGERLIERFQQLTAATGIEHTLWQGFMTQINQELDGLQAASRAHAEHWQTVLADCGMEPGQP